MKIGVEMINGEKIYSESTKQKRQKNSVYVTMFLLCEIAKITYTFTFFVSTEILFSYVYMLHVFLSDLCSFDEIFMFFRDVWREICHYIERLLFLLFLIQFSVTSLWGYTITLNIGFVKSVKETCITVNNLPYKW